jgi:chaperone modulatory protein CbpM
MMRTLSEVTVMLGRVERVEVQTWIEHGWVAPSERAGEEPVFSDLDVARAVLICDLRHDLDVEEETMPLVLSLLDQVYALRRRLNVLSDALLEQPEEVRRSILDLVEKRQRKAG